MKRILVIFISICSMALGSCASADKTESVSDEPKQEAPTNATVKVVDLMEGAGDAAQLGDTVQVNYTGWLYENGTRGKQFDTSVGKEPFEVILGKTQVIKGWTQGLLGMKIGGRRQLIIPPELAYGATGIPPDIPPNSTLEFEIDMVRMLPKAK